MAKSKTIIRKPNTSISVSHCPVTTIQVKQLKNKIYLCDLLSSDGKVLKANHTWAKGKHPFDDLTPDELKKLKPAAEKPAAADS